MSEAPEVIVTADQADADQRAALAASQASQNQQSGQGSQLAPPVATVHPIVQAVVTGVQATQPASNWAMTAASVLQGLMPIIQPAEQIARASVRTQGEVAIGVAALSVLLQAFFPHPGA